jgi:hypothetical protein
MDFVLEIYYVSCEVRTECLSIIQKYIRFILTSLKMFFKESNTQIVTDAMGYRV